MGIVAALLIEAFDPRARRAQRVGAATGNPVVVARKPDDEEAMLQLTSLLLGPLSGQDGAARPFVVAVLCPDVPSQAITAGLGDHVRRTNRSVIPRTLSDSHDDDIDRGFPGGQDRDAWDADVVLLDLGAIESQARRAMVASRSDSLVLIARARTPLSALRYWSNLARAGAVQTPGIWFQKRLVAEPKHKEEPEPEVGRVNRADEAAAPDEVAGRVG